MSAKPRKLGRPPKDEPPRVPYDELDRLLVHGELVKTADGAGETIAYLSYRELARRFDVSHSLVVRFSKKNGCLRRREEARARVAARAADKLVELRATAVAMTRDDELRIIDAYLAGFEKALAAGDVRFDGAADLNLMLRVKRFLEGGADARQEVRAVLSLDAIQEKHRRALREGDDRMGAGLPTTPSDNSNSNQAEKHSE